MRPVGAGIIIDAYARILLIKRSNYTKAFPYYWTMPGGKGNKQENPEEIAIREVSEEVGLIFIPEKLYHTCELDNSGQMVKSHRFLGTWTGKIDIQEEEADGYAWYTYEETKSLKIAFDYSEVIEKLYGDGLIK